MSHRSEKGEARADLPSADREILPDLHRALFDSAADAIFVKSPDGRYVMVNPAMAALFDRSTEEMPGLTDGDLFDDTFNVVIDQEDARVLAGEHVEEERSRIIAGKTRWFRVLKVPMRGEGGDITGICGVAREVTENHRLMAELQDFSDRYQAVVAQVPGVIFSYIRHPDDSRTSLYRSPGLEGLLGPVTGGGVRRNEIDFRDLIHPDDLEKVLEMHEEPETGHLINDLEYRVRDDSGQYRWVHGKARGIPQPDGSVNWNGLLLDIDNREHIRTELSQVSSRLQALADNLPGAAFSYLRRPDGTRSLRYLSSGAVRILGEGLTQRLEENFDQFNDLVHRDDRWIIAGEATRGPGERLSYDVEYRLRNEDGLYRWVNARARGTRLANGESLWHGILLDIDGRKRMEAELRETTDRLRSLADGLPGIVYSYIADAEDRRTVLYHSQGLESLVGPENALRILQDDDFFDSLIHRDDREGWLPVPCEEDPERLMVDHEHRLLTDTGGYRWGHTLAYGYPLGAGAVLWHGILLDIEDRKRAEENLRAANAQLRIYSTSLEASNRSLAEAKADAEAAARAKGQFLANMSHEIRTPLTAVLGFADILAGRLDTEENTEAIEVIRSNGRFLLTIINDILDLAKIEAGRLDVARFEFDPARELRDVAELMRPRAEEKGLELHVTFDATLPSTMRGDPTKLRQILINLIGNAIKFTEAGEVAMHACNGNTESTLCVEVTDTGVGIDGDEVHKLFEAFVQAENHDSRAYGGTGLGLAISKHLTEMLGGRIEAESREGGGSLFRVLLPIDERPEPARRLPPESAPAVAPDRLEARVLLAEDNRTNQRIVESILGQVGCQVELAADGRAAIEMVAAAGKAGRPFDAILMDIQMPVMDGLAATRALRESGCDLPIIALTAHAMDEDRQRCLDAGCDEHCAKPIDREELLGKLASRIRSV